MKGEVKVSSIKITIGKRDIELSVEEAKGLQSALNEILGGVGVIRPVEIIRDHIPYIPWAWQTSSGQSTGTLSYLSN